LFLPTRQPRPADNLRAGSAGFAPRLLAAGFAKSLMRWRLSVARRTPGEITYMIKPVAAR